MILRSTFLLGSAIGLLAAAHAVAASADPADRAAIAAGEKRFNQNCVYCHGNAGSGGRSAPLQGRSDLTPDYVTSVISNGKKRGSFIMPAWKETFSESEIRELTAYILSLQGHPSKQQ